jgi:hypothetical protein
MIAELIDVLRDENERGEISCLALVVVRHNGESSSMLYGKAAPVTLLGSLEILKGSVLSNELGGERDGPEHLN